MDRVHDDVLHKRKVEILDAVRGSIVSGGEFATDGIFY